MSIDSLVDAIRKDFTTLGLPDILEMALVSSTGKVIYTDLGKSVLARVSPFYNNMLLMSLGDNISLNVDATKTIIISRVSDLTILVALTDKKVGIVLTKVKSVSQKFGKLLDEIVPKQETAAQEALAEFKAEAETTQTVASIPPSEETVTLPEEQHEEPEHSLEVQAAAMMPAIPEMAVPIMVNEARAIIDEARANNVTLRALGGTAVAMHCPSAKHKAIVREYPDIDLVGHAKEGKGIKTVFLNLGFQPDKRFNALHGAKRLKFAEENSDTDVDVFLDIFEMCHKLDFKGRLELEDYTIPLADLLLTKLQIVELNEKDVRDIIAIIFDHEFGAGPEMIDDNYIANLCGNDWGLWKTISLSIERVLGFLGDYAVTDDEKGRIKSRLEGLKKRIDAEPKGTRWKMRASIGESRKWYETVEEVRR